MKICTNSQNLGWNSENFNKIGDVSNPGAEKLILVICACGLHIRVYASWISNEIKGREPHEGFSTHECPYSGTRYKVHGCAYSMLKVKGAVGLPCLPFHLHVLPKEVQFFFCFYGSGKPVSKTCNQMAHWVVQSFIFLSLDSFKNDNLYASLINDSVSYCFNFHILCVPCDTEFTDEFESINHFQVKTELSQLWFKT